MLIVNVTNNDNIDKALKKLKSKVINTKQQKQLLDRKEYTKNSVKRRNQMLSAMYKERKSKSL